MNRVEKTKRRISEFGLRIADRRPVARPDRRDAMTLIELMVVIVILMTLVGGVIPVLSPNNDARKIREASRGLQTYIMKAKTRAARTGRPAGIAIRETSPGSGVVLDVFQIEVPPPFAGFSSDAKAIFNRTTLPTKPDIRYEIHFGDGNGAAFSSNGTFAIPPRMARPGDHIRVGNALFQLSAFPRDRVEKIGGVDYFRQTNVFVNVALIAGSAPPTFVTDFNLPGSSNTQQWSHPNSYRVARQPVNTSEPPYTLPSGVAIDMHGSGTEGGITPTLFIEHEYTNVIKQIGIMFAPDGSVESVHYTSGKIFGPHAFGDFVQTPITDASKIFLLLGRVENVLDRASMNPNGGNSLVAIDSEISDEQFAEKQKQINWLNLDSRWLMCDARSGRTVVTENAYVNPGDLNLNLETYRDAHKNVRHPWEQMRHTRQFARKMNTKGGN